MHVPLFCLPFWSFTVFNKYSLRSILIDAHLVQLDRRDYLNHFKIPSQIMHANLYFFCQTLHGSTEPTNQLAMFVQFDSSEHRKVTIWRAHLSSKFRRACPSTCPTTWRNAACLSPVMFELWSVMYAPPQEGCLPLYCKNRAPAVSRKKKCHVPIRLLINDAAFWFYIELVDICPSTGLL